MHRANRRNRTSNRGGAAAIEFALTFPVLALILIATMDFGWFFSQQMVAAGAVRDAVRIGATTPDETLGAAEQAAEEVVVETLRRSGWEGDVLLDIHRTGLPPEESLYVGVSLPYRPLVGVVPTPTLVEASLSMRLEHQRI